MTLTCPRCECQLYPHAARRTVDGWACSNKGVCDARARSARLGEEIAWLGSFGWAPQQIAARLGVTVSCVQKRLASEQVAA